MKVRRITLLVLVSLTALLILQGWSFGVGKMFPGQSPITIDWGYQGGRKDASKEQEFTHQREKISALAIDNEFGQIFVQGTSGDVIRVIAEIAITAEDAQKGEELLQEFSIKESLVGNRLSYELEKSTPDQTMRGVAVNYRVEVPKGLELSIKQRYGVLNVTNVQAERFEYELRYVTAAIENFVGSLQGTSDFSSLSFRDVVGALQLQDNYSTMSLSLRDVVEGYDFRISQNYGSLKDNLKLQRIKVQEQVEATGKYGLGQYPVQIQSNFSTIDLKVE
ncbi:MAG: hypothetical protein GX956_09100 [Firmicutes bacterium]|nr:hypothetical protein [Bacillota bacterium]